MAQLRFGPGELEALGGTLESSFLAGFRYEGALAHRLVHRLKYAGVRRLAPAFAAGLADAWHLAEWSREVVLVPVPLTRARLRERGYNQAALVASALAGFLELPVFEGLSRVRMTTSQTRLGRSDRRSNLHGAFATNAATPYLPVVIVDDVRTTGATLEACRATLAASGFSVAGAAAAFATPRAHPARSGFPVLFQGPSGRKR